MVCVWAAQLMFDQAALTVVCDVDGSIGVPISCDGCDDLTSSVSWLFSFNQRGCDVPFRLSIYSLRGIISPVAGVQGRSPPSWLLLGISLSTFQISRPRFFTMSDCLPLLASFLLAVVLDAFMSSESRARTIDCASRWFSLLRSDQP